MFCYYLHPELLESDDPKIIIALKRVIEGYQFYTRKTFLKEHEDEKSKVLA